MDENNVIYTTKAVVFIKTRSPAAKLPEARSLNRQMYLKWSIILTNLDQPEISLVNQSTFFLINESMLNWMNVKATTIILNIT